MDVEQLSEYLGISKHLIWRYVKNREIPFIPFGRLVRFDRLAVERWAVRRTVRGYRTARGAGPGAQDSAGFIRPGNELDRRLAGEPS